MSLLKNKFLQAKQAVAKAAKYIAAKWRSLAPGFRYALVYFFCVICISALVWWQFSPGIQVFDPQRQQPEEPSPPAMGETPEQHEQNQQEDEYLEDERSQWATFDPNQGHRMVLPMTGEILTSIQQVFSPYPNQQYYAVTDGIHIDGTRGDAVTAAWRGVVMDVEQPGSDGRGWVMLGHGKWATTYINMADINVRLGEKVERGQLLGELAGTKSSYTGDYLEFRVMGPNGEYKDPTDFIVKGLEPAFKTPVQDR